MSTIYAKDLGRGMCDPYVGDEGQQLWKVKASHYNMAMRPRVNGYKSTWARATLNVLGSVHIALDELCTFDTLTGVVLSVLFVLAYWQYGQHLAVGMSWNVVSMGVIFPITQAIGMGFKRRENALKEFGVLLGNLRSLWGAIHG